MVYSKIRNWLFKDLRHRIIIPAMILFFLFLVIQAFISSILISSYFSILSDDQNSNLAKSVSRKINTFFDNQIEKINILSIPALNDIFFNEEYLKSKNYLDNYIKLNNEFYYIMFDSVKKLLLSDKVFKKIEFIDYRYVFQFKAELKDSGEVIIEENPYVDFPLFKSDYKQINFAFAKNIFAVSPVSFYDQEKRSPYVNLLIPYTFIMPGLGGYLYCQIDLKYMLDEFSSFVSSRYSIYIVDQDKNYFSPFIDPSNKSMSAILTSKEMERALSGAMSTSSKKNNRDYTITTFYPIRNYFNWALVIEYNGSAYLSFITKIQLSYILFSVFALLSGLIFFSPIITKAVKPVEVLSHNAKIIAQRGYLSSEHLIDDQMKAMATGEIIMLVDSFNNMIRTLNSAEKKASIELARRSQQEQLMIQQSKLAAMGEMISMIAHQWRQPLSSITTIAANLKVLIELDQFDKNDFIEMLNNINEQSQFLSRTINDFRGFFKLNENSRSVITGEIMEKTLGIIGKSLEYKNIRVIKEYHSLKKVNANPNELMQVFLNIIKNAYDALVSNQIVNPVINLNIFIEDNFQVIEIVDNGGGIKTGIIDDIFKPYFTTKEESKGTGLGLYISKIIITDHCKGGITVENNDTGACFRIKLPIMEDEV